MTFLELSDKTYPIQLEISVRAIDHRKVYTIWFVEENGRVSNYNAKTQGYEVEEDAVKEVLRRLGIE